MLETRHPLTIVTKNALVARDLDLLAELARRNLVVVYMSVTTLDAAMARSLEPRAAAPWRRLEAVRSLTDAGVPVGVLVAPIIPFINDESMEHILEAAKAAGAHASYTVLRLPWEVKTLFEDWLHAHFPDRAQRVLHRIEDLRSGRRNDPNFGSRMRGTGIWADLLRQRFSMAARKLGLNRNRLQLSCDQFMPPAVAGLDGAHDASSPFSHPGWRESVFRGPHASTAGVASVRGRSRAPRPPGSCRCSSRSPIAPGLSGRSLCRQPMGQAHARP